MFNWFDKLLVKVAKKILNRYAPKGEFIAYINQQEEKILKKLGGYGKPINETGIKSFISIGSVFSWVANTAAKAAPYLKWLKPFSTWLTYINMAIMVISWLRKPDIPDSPTMESIPEQIAKGILLNKTSSNAPLPVVYGKRKIGGTAVFLETSGSSTN